MVSSCLFVFFCLFTSVTTNGALTFCLSSFQMEDGQTLFDYNVGLNDIVQLLIRSHAESADSPATKEPSAPPAEPKSETRNSPAPQLSSPAAMETNTDNDSRSSVTVSTVNETKPDTSTTSNSANTKNGLKASSPTRDNQPPSSSRNTLTDPGIGVYKVRAGGSVWQLLAGFCVKQTGPTHSSIERF